MQAEFVNYQQRTRLPRPLLLVRVGGRGVEFCVTATFEVALRIPSFNLEGYLTQGFLLLVLKIRVKQFSALILPSPGPRVVREYYNIFSPQHHL